MIDSTTVYFYFPVFIIFFFVFFFFNDTATTEIYTLSLHDALPISILMDDGMVVVYNKGFESARLKELILLFPQDRKSTRLNSSHVRISYAVFCLKKKKKNTNQPSTLIYRNAHHH